MYLTKADKDFHFYTVRLRLVFRFHSANRVNRPRGSTLIFSSYIGLTYVLGNHDFQFQCCCLAVFRQKSFFVSVGMGGMVISVVNVWDKLSQNTVLIPTINVVHFQWSYVSRPWYYIAMGRLHEYNLKRMPRRSIF